MGCVNPDGTLSTQAKSILKALASPAELEEVAGKVELPLYRVRSAVRELAQANLVQEYEGSFRATPRGLDLLSS
jgi:hypothetical protein